MNRSMKALRQGACNPDAIPKMTPREVHGELVRLAHNYGLCEAPYTAAVMHAAAKLIEVQL
jgi:hypothetical protein